jgi:hypothetical protein
MKLTGYCHLRRETALLFSVRRYASLSHFVDLHHALFKYMLVALNNTKKNSQDVTWLSSAVLLVLTPAFLQQCRFTTMEGYPSQIQAIITRQLATALKH